LALAVLGVLLAVFSVYRIRKILAVKEELV